MGSEDTPSVAAVVVTYNNPEATLACIESLLVTGYDGLEVVVVDNGSMGEAATLEARFGDRVKTIRPGRNLGFGPGANLGIEWALARNSDYVWILNNDTTVPPGTIERLVAAMEADPGIGVASPQIAAPEGPEAPGGIWFAGGVLDLRRGETRHLVDPLPAGAVVASEFLTGCALMIRSRVLREVGTFWERLFLYWEDTDLDLRVRRAGWKTCVVADAWVRHEIHGAAPNRVVAYYHFRNALLVSRRHLGLRGAVQAAFHLTYVISRRWASAMLRRRSAPAPETRGLIAGIAIATAWSFRTPADVRLDPAPTEAAARPLRILHIVRRYAPLLGGTETYVRDLAEAQARKGHAARVLTLDRDVTRVVPGRLQASEERGGVRVVRLPGIGAQRFAITSRPWRLIGEISAADVVHVHDIRFMTATICLTARIRRRGIVVHTHGLIFHTRWAARLKRFLMRAYYGPVLRLTGAAIVASSRPDREALLELAPYLSKRVIVLENAIRLTGLLSLQRDPVAGRVLAFGRVAGSKTLDRLMAALANVDHQKWELWIAGAEEAGERARLEAISAHLGIQDRVRWLGPFSDAEFGPLLAGADVAAFPSSGEGFGLALLEAMAGGVPVLASDIPAHRALLGTELASNLVDFSSVDRASEKLAGLLAMAPAPKLEMGKRERSKAAEYDVSRLVEDIEKLYESLGVRS